METLVVVTSLSARRVVPRRRRFERKTFVSGGVRTCCVIAGLSWFWSEWAKQPSAPLLQFDASAECAARFEHGGDGRLITNKCVVF